MLTYLRYSSFSKASYVRILSYFVAVRRNNLIVGDKVNHIINLFKVSLYV